MYDGKELINYGVFETSLDNEFERVNAIKNWFVSMLDSWKPDYVGIEGI